MDRVRKGLVERLVRTVEPVSGTITWNKLVLIGAPGTECGRMLIEGGHTIVAQTFKDEHGECNEPARWIAGMLLLCQKHAAIVAEEFGDDITDIEEAWRELL